jgi:hypothetical protein
LVCQRCVGSHVLLTCRRLYFVVAVGTCARTFFLIFGIRDTSTVFSGSVSGGFLFFASFFFCRTVLDRLFSALSDFAVSSRSRIFLDTPLVRFVTTGVLSSLIYQHISHALTSNTNQLHKPLSPPAFATVSAPSSHYDSRSAASYASGPSETPSS